ncbi:MAG: hypothetical protein II393_01605 [Cytophagales bacterium]|nr:hypothetical protein [Cytophagales bacterium]
MYYNFKITKTGLRFLNITKKESTKKGVISLNKLDIEKINDLSITNPEKLQEVL